MGETDPRKQLIAVGERLAAACLVRESEGNLSIRLENSHCVVTSTGSDLGRLDVSDLVEVPIEASAIPEGASSEAQLHLELYRIRPDVSAIVHAHPPRLLRLDAEGQIPVWRRLEDRGKMLGSVVAVPHHAEGTLALARATAGALRTARACVLRKARSSDRRTVVDGGLCPHAGPRTCRLADRDLGAERWDNRRSSLTIPRSARSLNACGRVASMRSLARRRWWAMGESSGRCLTDGDLPSLVFWGPPGSGKTTIARLLADAAGAEMVTFSAVLSGVKEARSVMATARSLRRSEGRRTVLFVDEIHRFNRAQQDAFLPYVEAGDIVLVGATTENPSFELNRALLSRVKVYILDPLAPEQILGILRRCPRKRQRPVSAPSRRRSSSRPSS